jgi:excisionase family DNA binding protein
MGNKTAARRKAKAKPIPEGYLRVREAAAITDTSPSTIYRWIREKHVKAIKRGRVNYVHLGTIQHARRSQKRGEGRTVPDKPPAGCVTTGYASQVTGASQVSIQEWARKGMIRAVRHGRLWYVNLNDVKARARTMKPGRQR